MISRWLPLALSVVLLWPGILRAQTGTAYPGPKFPDAFNPSAAPSANYDKMYEDIEIMRRILDRKLKPLYPTHTYQTFGIAGMGGMPGMPGMPPGMGSGMGDRQNGMGMVGGMMPVTVPIRSLEGVYLKGQGVIYTATVSSLHLAAKTEPAKETVSEWESVRRQVRNEKEESKKTKTDKPASLSDVLLKALADNGHSFSQLGENEGLTIVLTVHKTNPPSPTQKSTGSASGSSAKLGAPQASGGGSDLHSQVRDLELLAELHMKQGKYDEAAEMFHKALGRKDNLKQQAELLRKLAQCHLLQGQDEKARNELDKAIILLKKEREAQERPIPAAKLAPALPVKLIIFAPKKLLDQMKEGKINFEEFRRLARVETLRFDERR